MFCNPDYLVVGSDSGRISILEYNSQKNMFEKVRLVLRGNIRCNMRAVNIEGASGNLWEKWMSSNSSRTVSWSGSKRACMHDWCC